MPTKENRQGPSEVRLLLCVMCYACFFTAAERSLRDAISIFGNLGFSDFTSVAIPNVFVISALFIVAVIGYRRKQQHFSALWGFLGSLLLIVGFLGSLYIHGLASVPLFLLICVGALFGVGSAFGFLSLIDVLSYSPSKMMLVILPASILSSAMGFATSSISDIVYIVSTCILFACVAAFCFLWLHFAQEGTGEPTQDSDESGSKAPVQYPFASGVRALALCLWRPALCVGAIAFMASIARSLVGQEHIRTTIAITFIGAMAAFFLLLVLFSTPASRIRPAVLRRFVPQRDDIISAYRLLFPINALLFLPLAFFGEGYAFFLAGVAEISTSICHVLMWEQSAEFGRRLGIPPFVVLGFFSSVVYLTLFFGYAIVYLGGANLGYSFYAVTITYVLAMVLFISLRGGGQRSKADPSSAGRGSSRSMMARSPQGLTVAEGTGEVEKRYIDSLSGVYRLSEREAQVLGILIKGRDIPYVAETLCLSRNTVRTHTKNIYAKLGVHSRQELLDEFEAYASSADTDRPR